MAKKNSAQSAAKQIKETTLLLKVLFMKFLMDFSILMQNSGIQ
jgi:hypothetical protein